MAAHTCEIAVRLFNLVLVASSAQFRRDQQWQKQQFARGGGDFQTPDHGQHFEWFGAALGALDGGGHQLALVVETCGEGMSFTAEAVFAG